MSLHTLSAYDHYGYAAVAMFGTLAAVLTIAWLMRASRWRGWLQSLRGVVPPFINIIGVLFGLTLAFIANDTWNAHDKATTAVYREADALRGLALLAKGLPAPEQAAMQTVLLAYAEAAVQEWSALGQRQASPTAAARADELLQRVADPLLAQRLGPQVQALMLKKAADLRDDRDLRISLSQMHVNPLKWLGMAYLGLLTLLSVAAVHVDNARAATVAIVLFAASAAPTAAIVLIQGNPFQQPSFVSPVPIQNAIEKIAIK